MKIKNKREVPVTIAAVGFDPVSVDAGGVADVPDELGESLLRQVDRWEEASSPKSTKKETD